MIIAKNPDPEFRKNFTKRLKANNGYCPCALERSPDTKCKCKAFRDQVEREEVGWCECGFFFAQAEKEEE